MNKMRLLLAGALLLMPHVARAQAIRGIVIDNVDGRPISGVIVEGVLPTGELQAVTHTDSAGSFSLRMDRPGPIQLWLSHPSFTASGGINVTLEPGETVVELRMGRVAVPLQPLVVRFERDARLAGFHERLLQPGSGQFLTRAEIDTRPAARTTDLLREMHGVEIVPTGGGMSRPRVQLIALRGCQPSIFIDGIAVRQFADSGVDEFLSPDMLYGVEVYTSGASVPSQFTSRDGCGVVAFWTRPVDDVEPWNWTRIAIGAGSVGGLIMLILFTR